MQRSTVKWFDAKKGYGFIDHPEGGDDVFVHYSQIISEKDFKTLRTGQKVQFEMSDGPKGLHALDVKPSGEDGENATKKAASETEAAGVASEAGETAMAGAQQEDAALAGAPSSEAAEHAGDDAEEEDDWESEWDEEEWTDEHGNPPDPMAGPTF